MKKGQDMTEHINYVKTLSEHLEAIDDAIAEKDLVILLISSLPEEYNFLITALETIAEDNLTWDYVRDRLIHESEKKTITSTGESNEALFTKQNDKRGKCHYCKKPGHYSRDCYKRKNDLKKKESLDAKIVTEDENSDNQPHEIALKSSAQSKGPDWWIDSGASQHMTQEKKSLSNYSPFEQPRHVKIADDHILYAYGKGNAYLTVLNGDEKLNITLKDVLFVPKLQSKLFSVPTVGSLSNSNPNYPNISDIRMNSKSRSNFLKKLS